MVGAKKDELDWDSEECMEAKENLASDSDNEEEDSTRSRDLRPLTEWAGAEIVTTQCSNVGAVIEWVFVPYVVEDKADVIADSDNKDGVDKPAHETNGPPNDEL